MDAMGIYQQSVNLGSQVWCRKTFFNQIWSNLEGHFGWNLKQNDSNYYQCQVLTLPTEIQWNSLNRFWLHPSLHPSLSRSGTSYAAHSGSGRQVKNQNDSNGLILFMELAALKRFGEKVFPRRVSGRAESFEPCFVACMDFQHDTAYITSAPWSVRHKIIGYTHVLLMLVDLTMHIRSLRSSPCLWNCPSKRGFHGAHHGTSDHCSSLLIKFFKTSETKKKKEPSSKLLFHLFFCS